MTRGLNRKNIHGITVCRGTPPISLLVFADDSILFARAIVSKCLEVAKIISLYEETSGQRVNYEKIEIFFSKGIPQDIRQHIVMAMRVKEVDMHSKYLGLSIVTGKIFDLAFVQAILVIPLSQRRSEDKLFWGYNKNDLYSVRSGYWLGMLSNRHESGVTNVTDNLWKQIWSLHGPPKLKHFFMASLQEFSPCECWSVQ